MRTKWELNNQEVEVTDIDKNQDGSRYVASAYYSETGEDLTNEELDKLQELYDDVEELNGMWRG